MNKPTEATLSEAEASQSIVWRPRDKAITHSLGLSLDAKNKENKRGVLHILFAQVSSICFLSSFLSCRDFIDTIHTTLTYVIRGNITGLLASSLTSFDAIVDRLCT